MIITVINAFATIIEILLSVILMDSFFEQRFKKKYLQALVIVLASAALFGINFIYSNYPIKTAAEVLLVVSMLFLLYKGNVRDAVLYFVLWGLGLSLSNFLANIFISMLPSSLLPGLDSALFFSALRIIVPKLLLMLTVFLLSAFLRRKTLELALRYWLALLAVPLVTVAVLSVFQYYVDSMPPEARVWGDVTSVTVNGTQYSVPGLTIYGYIVVAAIGLFFINVLVFTLFARSQRSAEQLRQYELQQKQNEMQSRSIERLESSYTRMRELRHDMQNQLVVLNSLVETEKYDELKAYIKTMMNTVDEAAFMTISGQSAVDAILNDKLAAAHKNRVATNFEIAKLDGELFAEPMDLCIILANALDNALEACAKIPEGNERYIKLKIARTDDYIVISCANPVAEEPKQVGGRFVSDKTDGKNHGFGLRSITDTAKKYRGEQMTRCADGVFTIIVKLNKS
ncbi:MAG: GHKL domain-containing protein [Clostridia bacterium]|nr:GHKL domain-containing protein [Clostridia bacterium]